jgi:hypothetical protein
MIPIVTTKAKTIIVLSTGPKSTEIKSITFSGLLKLHSKIIIINIQLVHQNNLVILSCIPVCPLISGEIGVSFDFLNFAP